MEPYNAVFYHIILGFIWFLNILAWAIIINSLLSWVLDPMHPIRNILGRFIEPVVAPFRSINDRLNTSGLPMDFSPLLAYICLQIIIKLLQGLL